jgi:hypothetical protein
LIDAQFLDSNCLPFKNRLKINKKEKKVKRERDVMKKVKFRRFPRTLSLSLPTIGKTQLDSQCGFSLEATLHVTLEYSFLL